MTDTKEWPIGHRFERCKHRLATVCDDCEESGERAAPAYEITAEGVRTLPLDALELPRVTPQTPHVSRAAVKKSFR